MKRILFILLILNTCFLSLYAQKHKKKTVKNERTEQQINQNKATKKRLLNLFLQKNRLKNTCLIGVKLQLNIVRNNL